MNRSPIRQHAAMLVSSLALLTSIAVAQTEVLVATGDVLPGLGTIDEVFEVAIDDAGNWIVSVHTDSLAPDEQAVILNGTVVLKPGDPIPGPVPGMVFSHARSLTLNGTGDFGWASGFFPVASSAGSGAYTNQAALAVTGDLLVAPGITPGTTYKGFLDQVLEGSGSLLVHAMMDEVATIGLKDDVLVRLAPTPAGGVTTTVLHKRGDNLPGKTQPVWAFQKGSGSLASNAFGQVLYVPTFQSGGDGVYLDQTPLALSGDQAPVFGRLWGSFINAPVDLNDAGDFAFGGRMTGDSNGDYILVWNGIKLVQEGDSLPAISPFHLTDLGFSYSEPGTLRLTGSGAVIWQGTWDDADTSRNSGLFRDHQLLLQAGETWVDGAQIADFLQASSFSPRPIFDINSDASKIAFRAVLTDGRTGAFLVRPDGLVETISGCVPNPGSLSAASPPAPGSTSLLVLENAQSEGATGFTYLSTQLASGSPPCGTTLPGVGELLIDLSPASLLTILPGWFPAISGKTFASFPLPSDPQLFGMTFFVQGLWLDTPGTAPAEPIRLTNALALTIGL